MNNPKPNPDSGSKKCGPTPEGLNNRKLRLLDPLHVLTCCSSGPVRTVYKRASGPQATAKPLASASAAG